MPLRRAGKKMRAPLLGLAKYIYFTPKVLGFKVALHAVSIFVISMRFVHFKFRLDRKLAAAAK